MNLLKLLGDLFVLALIALGVCWQDCRCVLLVISVGYNGNCDLPLQALR